jgi:four helix bundle protein
MSDTYKHLEIWKEAIVIAETVYLLTKKFPKEETFNIVSQLRRASISIASNIAEGSSRKSKKDFSRFIEISIGSLYEVESLLEMSKRLDYINANMYDRTMEDMQKLANKLGAFRNYLQK